MAPPPSRILLAYGRFILKPPPGGCSAAPLDTPRVALVGGQHLEFHALVVATGAEPRRLPTPWDMSGVVERPIGSGRIEGVRLDDGRVEQADVVVAGIGVTPRTASIEGVDVDDGIVVDRQLRTSVPRVLAAGDVANAFHPRYGRHIRVEHWANALNQGATARASAAGRNLTYDRLPYFSNMYDDGLEYVGHAGPDHDLVIRGDLTDSSFIAFWHRHRVIDAAMHMNTWDSIDDLKELVAAAAPVDLERLADPTTKLSDPRS